MGDDAVPGDRLGGQHGTISVERLEQSFDPAMLIAEHDLEHEDLLAVRLKAKMPGLDYAGVHGTNRDLVDLVPVDPLEDMFQRMNRLCPFARAMVRRVTAQRTEPRMTVRYHCALFGDLSLEYRCLRAIGSNRGIAGADHGAGGAKMATLVVSHDRDQSKRLPVFRRAEQCDDPPSVRHRSGNALAEGIDRQIGHIAEFDRSTIAEARKGRFVVAHGAWPPNVAAAAEREASRGPRTSMPMPS